ADRAGDHPRRLRSGPRHRQPGPRHLAGACRVDGGPPRAGGPGALRGQKEGPKSGRRVPLGSPGAGEYRTGRSGPHVEPTPGSELKKNFVLDTNVLLHDPNAIFAFEDNTVVIPIYVIEEIDRFKRDLSELGRSAREIGRMLDDLRKEGNLG